MLISKDGIADRNFRITNNNAIDMHVEYQSPLVLRRIRSDALVGVK